MTIFVNSDTRVIVQGMTGAEGRKHTQRMLFQRCKFNV